jgi:endonuclease YncB( thermonuclease family)|tara:strand:+ start:600 stop:1085 length:486 start_codon:yes stop_codon:yes gene_type:complete
MKPPRSTFFATIAVAALIPLSASATDLTGKPRIIDGDTIVIAGQRIRLHGIDAPEAKQTCQRQDGTEYRCGDMATFALAGLIMGLWVRCEGGTTDRYGRLIGTCIIGRVNLNAEMVRRGWALAYRRYSSDYVDEEDEARMAGRGLWQGRFEPPWEWRRGKR